MAKKQNLRVPTFASLEEERAYWDARSPLAPGKRGRLHRPEPAQKHSSFLAVRMTGKQLTELRDMASKASVGPSTYARLILTAAIEQRKAAPKRLTVEELKQLMQDAIPKDKRTQTLFENVAIGGPENPAALLIDASQAQELGEVFLKIIVNLLDRFGCQVIVQERDEEKTAETAQRSK